MVELLKVLPAFTLTVLVIVAVPGQGMAMVLRQSIVSGKEAAFYSVFGNTRSTNPRITTDGNCLNIPGGVRH